MTCRTRWRSRRGKAVAEILIASSVTNLTVRYQPLFPRTVEDIANIRILLFGCTCVLGFTVI